MKKYLKVIYLVITIIAITLEALPIGAVLNFAPSPAETVRRTYSYFSITPFGYANFGPFVTALLSCVLFIISLILLFVDNGKAKTALFVCGAVSTVTSLLPLIFGITYFSVVGCCITVLLSVATDISYKMMQQDRSDITA